MLRGSNWERFFQIDSLADVRISFASKFYETLPQTACLLVALLDPVLGDVTVREGIIVLTNTYYSFK